MNCKCTMAQSLVGDGCDICNPELAQEHKDLTAFDEWFDDEKHDEIYRDMFENVWFFACKYIKEK